MTDLAERRGAETEVYQPAEDSHLLAETAIADLQREADETPMRVLGSDVNPHACAQARERGVEAVRADLVSPFRDETFDAVLFNPPYLPTSPDEERDDWMEVALSGGEDGREVIEPFLRVVGRVLAPEGAVYLLVSSLTGVDEVVALAAAEGFSAVALRDESFPFETLTVLKLLR